MDRFIDEEEDECIDRSMDYQYFQLLKLDFLKLLHNDWMSEWVSEWLIDWLKKLIDKKMENIDS